MSVSGRKNFEKWYDEQVAKNVEFDFQNELVEYCESDVKLLKQGCLTFKRVFEKAKRQSLTRGTTSQWLPPAIETCVRTVCSPTPLLQNPCTDGA